MLLVAGSANLDFVVRAPHIPQPGETVLGRDFQTFAGGKGANQAAAAARAGGANTHMLLALGADAFATPIEASLASAGVVLHTVRCPDQPTGTAFICVSDDAENAITVAPGANHALLPQHLDLLQQDGTPLSGVSHLLLQLETPLPTVLAYAQAARARGVCVVLNAAPAQPLPPALLACVDVLVVNEGELAVVADHAGTIAQCLESINVPTVVVTLGHHGACARTPEGWVLQGAFQVAAIDTTGAGDTFCGTLAAGLCDGQTLPFALRKANAAAALACTTLGAQSSIPSADQLAAFMAAHPPETEVLENAPDALAHNPLQKLRQLCGLSP